MYVIRITLNHAEKMQGQIAGSVTSGSNSFHLSGRGETSLSTACRLHDL